VILGGCIVLRENKYKGDRVNCSMAGIVGMAEMPAHDNNHLIIKLSLLL
jgi:hypothetical protein